MNIMNPLVVVSLFSFTLFLGFGLYPVSTFAQNVSTQTKPKYQYPQEIVKTYISSCRQHSIKEGLTEQQATIVCQCMINRFQSQYSFEKFLKIYTQAQKTKESPDEFVDVGVECASNLLQ